LRLGVRVSSSLFIGSEFHAADKREEARGTYLRPEAFDQPATGVRGTLGRRS
jgi:hypothetical protein